MTDLFPIALCLVGIVALAAHAALGPRAWIIMGPTLVAMIALYTIGGTI